MRPQPATISTTLQDHKILGVIRQFPESHNNPMSLIDPLGLAIYDCKRPLGGKPGEGTGWGPFYHQYTCISFPNSSGGPCGGLIPTGSIFGSPGGSGNDSYHPKSCNKVLEDSPCYEKCLIDTWAQPRPYYDISLGSPNSQNCQTYDLVNHMICRNQCGGVRRPLP